MTESVLEKVEPVEVIFKEEQKPETTSQPEVILQPEAIPEPEIFPEEEEEFELFYDQ